MSEQKALCPYCGEPMKIHADEFYDGSFAVGYAYCPACGSYGPTVKAATDETVKRIRDDIKAAAMRRPLQKPMTMEEAWKKSTTLFGNVVWIEFKDESEDYSDVIPALISNYAPWPPGAKHPPTEYLFRYLTWPKDVIEVEKAKYGQKHRCWASRPTDEERAAAPWEE